MIQKLFPGLVASAIYDYFIYFLDIFKLGLFDQKLSADYRGLARIYKKYLRILRKFLTFMTSQLMTSYRETNITKKKNKLEFHSNH